MSHTNTTTNYNLPQFVGTDKPSWLTDVNGAMTSIDTQMKLNADTAGMASSTATTNATAIGTLSSLATTNKTDLVSAINEVDTELGTVSGVASGASTTATQAKTKVDNLETYLSLTNFGTPAITLTNVTTASNTMRFATNASGTIGKIYGSIIDVKTTSSAGGSITMATPFRPDTTITINGAFLQQYQGNQSIFSGDITIATDGTLTITRSTGTYNNTYNIIFPACLYFFKDFGDM